MDLAKQIIAECFTLQGARARLLVLREEAEKEYFDKKKTDPGDKLDAFSQAEKEIEAVPELAVFVAAGLPEASQNRLGQKARADFGQTLFLDFKIDPGLLGGCALAWKGQYKDFSVKARFEEKKAELDKIVSLWLTKSVL